MPNVTEDMIPQEVQDFAKEFVALANKHGLSKGYITCRFGMDSASRDRKWPEDINIVWEEGRHGEDGRKFHINTTLRMWGKIPY